MTVAKTTDWRISALALIHDVEHRQPCLHGPRRVLAQPAHHVLDVDDRIVHELTDGNGQAAETHAVERQPEAVHGKHRGDERQWQRQQGDRGGTHVHQEQRGRRR